jgi:hypothetical protein
MSQSISEYCHQKKRRSVYYTSKKESKCEVENLGVAAFAGLDHRMQNPQDVHIKAAELIIKPKKGLSINIHLSLYVIPAKGCATGKSCNSDVDVKYFEKCFVHHSCRVRIHRSHTLPTSDWTKD